MPETENGVPTEKPLKALGGFRIIQRIPFN